MLNAVKHLLYERSVTSMLRRMRIDPSLALRMTKKG